MTIVYFVLILGITVFIHELGHFLFAKKYGVYVYEFSLGMGPRIFKFKRKNDETDYCIRLFPIGGFVQMAGEEVEVDEEIPEKNRLQSKTPFQRFMICIAGVMMNFILSIVLLFFIGLFNRVSLNNVYVRDSIVSNLNENDKIVSVNGHFVNNYDKLALELAIASDHEFNMTVKDENSNKKTVKISPINVGKSNLIYGKDYGFEVNDLEISKSSINDIKVGDKIISINGKNVNTYLEMLNELNNSKENIILTVIDGESVEKSALIKVKDKKQDESVGYSYGFYITGKAERGFLSAIKYAFYKFFSTIEQMIFTVLYLCMGKLSLSMLSGPVGIFNVVSIYSKYGFSNIVSLLCLICINVGFINILPLPAFDGGHVLFIVIEKIRGKRVNPKVENTIHNVGLIILMALMVLITYNDIIKLF